MKSEYSICGVVFSNQQNTLTMQSGTKSLLTYQSFSLTGAFLCSSHVQQSQYSLCASADMKTTECKMQDDDILMHAQ